LIGNIKHRYSLAAGRPIVGSVCNIGRSQGVLTDYLLLSWLYAHRLNHSTSTESPLGFS
jgi:hypothetical protein